MKPGEIEQCDKLLAEIAQKRLRLTELMARKESRSRSRNSPLVNSMEDTLKEGVKVLSEVSECLKKVEQVVEKGNDLKMSICCAEQVKLDSKPGSGSLLIAAGSTRESSQKLADGLTDLSATEMTSQPIASVVESVQKLTEIGERTYLAAAQCLTRGELIKTDF